MIEIQGNLWDYYQKPKTTVLITTNGTIKKNGEVVMGRGVAWEAAQMWPQLPKMIGKFVSEYGNKMYIIRPNLWTFPVKHNWWEKADLKLITESTKNLYDNVTKFCSPERKFYLPKPGCGNGKLNWADVKPIVECLPDNVYIIDNSETKAYTK